MFNKSVIWITGMSGVGKSTIGNHLKDIFIKNKQANPLLLDGDDLRDIFGNDLGYSRDDRLKSAMRNSKLCKYLSEQGNLVICCTISMFHSCQEWNKININNYYEVYIKANMKDILSKDPKKIYSRNNSLDTANNIVGIDIKMEEPLSPNLIIENDYKLSPIIIAQNIFASFLKDINLVVNEN